MTINDHYPIGQESWSLIDWEFLANLVRKVVVDQRKLRINCHGNGQFLYIEMKYLPGEP